VAPPTVDLVIAALRRDEVVVVPTDTVYGLATRLAAPAIERLFELKGRSADKPFAVLIGRREAVPELATPNAAAIRLMDRFWPGPLTIVTRRADGLDVVLGGDPATIGIRLPDSPQIVALTAAVGPLVTTSANRSGRPCLTSLTAIADTFGAEVAVSLDGGVLSGDPSTVVDATTDPVTILRAGPLDPDVVRAVADGLA
jgi:tRNA threonylcarbamoyl adenosine modification protein (Sua5/YciO/YrdC/YwlC family)